MDFRYRRIGPWALLLGRCMTLGKSLISLSLKFLISKMGIIAIVAGGGRIVV